VSGSPDDTARAQPSRRGFLLAGGAGTVALAACRDQPTAAPAPALPRISMPNRDGFVGDPRPDLRR
jgi:hypothetical protein